MRSVKKVRKFAKRESSTVKKFANRVEVELFFAQPLCWCFDFIIACFSLAEIISESDIEM